MTASDNYQEDKFSINVFIKNIRGSEIASKLSGYFVINGKEFRFRAIAFGRIGGHNISLSIAKKTLQELRKIGIDPEIVQLKVQRKLIEGDVILQEGLKEGK